MQLKRGITVGPSCWSALRTKHALVADVDLSVRCPSHGRISKTKQNRPIVTKARYVAVANVGPFHGYISKTKKNRPIVTKARYVAVADVGPLSVPWIYL